MYRIYISFPISGYDLEERKQYAIQKEAELIDDFYNQRGVYKNQSFLQVITPFVVNKNEKKDSYARKMGNDIEALLECDAIYMCNGWQNSKGCMAEFEVARIYGKEIIIE